MLVVFIMDLRKAAVALQLLSSLFAIFNLMQSA